MKYHVDFDIDLKRNPYKGIYIAVEGIDGCGKTTQIEKLKESLENLGKKTILVKEPGREGIVRELIDKILQGKVKVLPEVFQYLCSAERVILHETKIIPSLKSGKFVISDRCFWSAVAYGILDRTGLDYQKDEGEILLTAQGILSMYHQFIVPDYTFFLDVSVETAMKRLSKLDREKEIYEKREKLEKIALGYKWLVEKFPKEFIAIDGEQPVEEIASDIINKIKV
ncbi:MAG: dTMP kinase [bacterium]|nr:dTMP kinase [bacterium]